MTFFAFSLNISFIPAVSYSTPLLSLLICIKHTSFFYSHFRKGAGMQITYSLIMYIHTNVFLLLKKMPVGLRRTGAYRYKKPCECLATWCIFPYPRRIQQRGLKSLN